MASKPKLEWIINADKMKREARNQMAENIWEMNFDRVPNMTS